MKRHIGIYSFFIFFSLIISQVNGQIKDPFNHAVCDTKVSDTGYYMRNAESFLSSALANKNSNPSINDFSAPYNIRVFIRIVRQDDGTFPGCDVATAVQNFEEMKGQYNAHNICFQLVGVDFVDDTYLNNFNSEANTEIIYPDYIKNNNLDVDGAVTIFIHYNFLNNNSSSGTAYGIPNNFFSVARWAVNSTSVHSIFGHEMGHCLGLYHTFENENGGQENVTRNPVNITCYNCNTAGDLCCDTPADYENSQDYTDTSTCVFTGSMTNSCDNLDFNPSTVNIMSYQPWSCISTTSTAITANQRTRMHATILDFLAPIYTRVSENTYSLANVSANSDVVRVYAAKNTISTGVGVTHSQTANSKAYYVAGTSITFSPGIKLSPGTDGVAQASISSSCN